MYGPVCNGQNRKIRHNQEVYALFKKTGVFKIIKLERLQWNGHVARMCEAVIPKKIMEGICKRFQAVTKTKDVMVRLYCGRCTDNAWIPQLEGGYERKKPWLANLEEAKSFKSCSTIKKKKEGSNELPT